jgi:chaperonin GroEL
LAVLTGGQVIAEDFGLMLEHVPIGQLGHAKRVVIGKGNTPIIGGANEREAIASRIKQIPREIEKAMKDHDFEKLQERLAKLVGWGSGNPGAGRCNQRNKSGGR